MKHKDICPDKTATQPRVITPQLIPWKHILNKNKKNKKLPKMGFSCLPH
jgi:hypothetical protein